MTVQSTFTFSPAAAVEGLLYDAEADVVSAMCDLAGGIPFGRFVTRGSADGRAVLPDATGEVTGGVGMGFSIFVHREQAATPLGYAENAPMSVMRDGRIWVLSETDVAYGGAVFVRFAAGAGGTALGAVRKDADTASAVALPGATFRGTLAATGLVVIEFHPTL